MATTSKLLTAEQYAAVADDSYSELVRGEIVMMNMPSHDHGVLCNRVGRIIGNFVEDHDLGTVTAQSGMITERDPDSVRGPDIAFFSYDRIPKHERTVVYPRSSPELVFEVNSPNDRWPEIYAKVAEYLKAGVVVVSVIDPKTETIAVFRADRPEQQFRLDDTLTLPEVLPGFSVPVRKMFHA
jgi:Uma2 family endonuclease